MGMKIATKTNVRTTQAARTSLPQALKVSFGGGTVMGLGVAGLAVLGLQVSLLFINYFMGGVWTNTEDMTIVLETLLVSLLELNLSHCLLVLVVVFIPKLLMLVLT
jgi:K(+)-stimulated pyrophosphate-energized sodium pump